MENIKPVITLMAQSAVREHKTVEFLSVMEKLKLRVFEKVLLKEINSTDAENLKAFILEQEREVKNAI